MEILQFLFLNICPTNFHAVQDGDVLSLAYDKIHHYLSPFVLALHYLCLSWLNVVVLPLLLVFGIFIFCSSSVGFVLFVIV